MPDSSGMGFYHDVLRDWSIGNFIDEDHARLLGLDFSVPVSPRVARGIEFAGRLALETGQDGAAWFGLLARLSPVGAHSSWRRQGLLAIVRSEIGLELLERCGVALLANGGDLFTEIATAIAAVETVPTADLYAAMNVELGRPIPRSLRTNTTGTGVCLLSWVIQHALEIPIQAIGTVVDLIENQFVILKGAPAFAKATGKMLFDWLRQLDVRNAEVVIPMDAGAARLDGDVRRRMVEKLRTMALLLSAHAPEDAKAYLREIAAERYSYKIKAIRPMSPTLAAVAPIELSALITNSLHKRRERTSSYEISDGHAFSFADSDYLPASPAQPPFLNLLTAAPRHGLSLVRELVDVAVEYHSNGGEPGDNGYTAVFDDGPRFFPWIQTY